MLTAPLVLLRTIGLICGGHRAVALENLALRQQVAVLKRTVKRPRLRTTDRLFWILVTQLWRGWRGVRSSGKPENRRARHSHQGAEIGGGARTTIWQGQGARRGRHLGYCPS